VTRTLLLGALLTTAACVFELVSPYTLYFSWGKVRRDGWRSLHRFVTTFFFFSERFSIDFLMNMFFLVRYSRSLEEETFRGRTADYVWMLLVGAVFMVVCMSPLPFMPHKQSFLGGSLVFMMIYVWSRRNPHSRMNMIAMFTFNAPYLPWVLVAFSFALGGSVAADLVGIFVGHVYYFFEDVFPIMTGGTRLLRTPRALQLLFVEGLGGAMAAGAAFAPVRLPDA
jgi:Derlin-2/3